MALQKKLKMAKYVYMEIQHGIYGVQKAGILANKIIKQYLEKHGYFELPHTPGLFKHIPRPVWFTLLVYDFGIKYIGEENAKHLLKVRKELYKIKKIGKGVYIAVLH